MLPGIIGSLQAAEAIKWILGSGEALTGRLLHFDAMAARFREFRLKRDPQCAVCGENPTITEPIDYEQFCGTKRSEEPAATPHEDEITVQQVAGLKAEIAGGKVTLLDVREPFELAIAKIGGSLDIPMGEIPARLEEIPRDRRVLVLCKVGQRSAMVADYLRREGWEEVSNITGGIDAWASAIEPDLPRY